jgi:C4-dicarboxylate transporter/malic acid transport protein
MVENSSSAPEALNAVVPEEPDASVPAAPLSRLQGFHPGWYGAVMGTAIIAIAASLNPGSIASLAGAARDLAEVMFWVTSSLAVILAVPYLGRIIAHPGDAWADLRDPVSGALYATFPGGILVLALVVAQVGPLVLPHSTISTTIAVLAGIGMPLGFVISLAFAYLLFTSPHVTSASANGGWFIPPVVNIVMPLVLLPLLPTVDPAMARGLLFLAYAFWGMGFVLFILVASQFYDRLTFHPPPPTALAPATWIGLGPIGVGSLALEKMAQAGSHMFSAAAPSVEILSRLAASALWGFGLWWLGAAILLLAGQLRAGHLSYGIGWWAFTFPLGAFTVSTLTLERAWKLSAVEDAGGVLFVLLVCFWLVVVGGTVRAMRTGTIWHPKLD